MTVRQRNATFDYSHMAAPGFWLALYATPDAITGVEFLTERPNDWRDAPLGSLLAEAASQITAWLKSPDFRFDLPVYATGTDFRQRVWALISAIPSGETRTYGDLAKALNSAPRAVGQACGDNPLPILVPCHRVVGQNGLGGFNHDRGDALLNIKRWLLTHERGHG